MQQCVQMYMFVHCALTVAGLSQYLGFPKWMSKNLKQIKHPRPSSLSFATSTTVNLDDVASVFACADAVNII